MIESTFSDSLPQILLSVIAILAAVGLAMVKRVLDRIEHLYSTVVNHIIDDARHVTKQKDGHAAVMLLVCIVTSMLLSSCATGNGEGWRGLIPSFSTQKTEPIKSLSSEEVISLKERIAIIRWTTALLALGTLGMLLPDMLFSKAESITSIASALAFYMVARWSQAAAPVMKWVLPTVLACILLSMTYRYWGRFVKSRKPILSVPDEEPAPSGEV